MAVLNELTLWKFVFDVCVYMCVLHPCLDWFYRVDSGAWVKFWNVYLLGAEFDRPAPLTGFQNPITSF